MDIRQQVAYTEFVEMDIRFAQNREVRKLTIEEMRRIKQEHGLSYQTIAEETGVPFSTVSKILMGVTKSPRRATLQALSSYFTLIRQSDTEKRSEDRRQDGYLTEAPLPAAVHESAAIYGRQKGNALSIGQKNKVERSTAPATGMPHADFFRQELLLCLYQQLNEALRASGSTCRAFPGVVDVLLSKDPLIRIRPDLFVARSRNDFEGTSLPADSTDAGSPLSECRFLGAPPLIIEILSPFTQSKAVLARQSLCLDAGVQEYWIVDPLSQKVIVWDFDAMRDGKKNSRMLSLYSFDQEVPVLISDGTCTIDFPAIRKELQNFWGKNLFPDPGNDTPVRKVCRTQTFSSSCVQETGSFYNRALAASGETLPVSQVTHQNSFEEKGSSSATELMTIAGRDALPDERRTELIDGVLYDMASPGPFHQQLCKRIAWQLDSCIDASDRRCEVFLAPMDVVLSEDPDTVVQPDLFVACDPDRFRPGTVPAGMQEERARMLSGKYYGAPSLVIEILSPSTRQRDVSVKLEKYLDAGVREYWAVDPENQGVIVWDLETMRENSLRADMIHLYSFQQSVPVRISDGTCAVDFPAIQKIIDAWWNPASR